MKKIKSKMSLRPQTVRLLSTSKLETALGGYVTEKSARCGTTDCPTWWCV
jgi:hypothetical protein